MYIMPKITITGKYISIYLFHLVCALLHKLIKPTLIITIIDVSFIMDKYQVLNRISD